MNDVTIVIPTFNLTPQRLRNLKFIFKSLPKNVPVFVIEQIPSDYETSLKLYCDSQKIRYEHLIVDSKYIHKSKLINTSVDRINTEYIWVIDADCYLPFDSILNKEFKHDFIHPYRMGKRLTVEETTLLQSGNPVDINFDYSEKEWYNYLSMYGALSFIFRKTAFVDMGGMNEQYFGWGYEDRDLHTKILLNEPDFTDDNYLSYFTCYSDMFAVHLHHDDQSGGLLTEDTGDNDIKSITFRNKVVYDYNFTLDDSNFADDIFDAFNKPTTCNIVTMFRGDNDLLDNIDIYLSSEDLAGSSLTWIINSNDPEFIESAKTKSFKYNDIRLIITNEHFSASDYYWDSRHEFIGGKYAEVLPTISSDYIITLEDDIIPPKNGVVKIINSIKRRKCAAIAAIYSSKDSVGDVCGVFSKCVSRLSVEQVKNLGEVSADRFGGGFTIWDTSALREVYPISFNRISESVVEGWDWMLTGKLKNKKYDLFINTDIICDHLI